MSSTDYRPRFGYDIRINPDPPPRRPAAGARACAIAGCREPAECNVPKHRDNLEDRQWLCRAHLREHNAGWNYFAGMLPDEIERYCHEAITGHRPTWPLGKRAARPRGEAPRQESGWSYHFEDGFAIFEEVAEPAARAAAPKRRLTKSQLDALAALNLEETATLHDIKARYKELVKRFHPDANGGNRGTEERLRQVIKAYGHLRATGFA
jgi:hypothetical protein